MDIRPTRGLKWCVECITRVVSFKNGSREARMNEILLLLLIRLLLLSIIIVIVLALIGRKRMSDRDKRFELIERTAVTNQLNGKIVGYDVVVIDTKTGARFYGFDKKEP